jgi:hypothetical protein
MYTHTTYQDLLAQVRLLSFEDEVRLVAEIMDDLRQRMEKSSKPRYNVLDFEGIAQGVWDEAGGVDEFIKQERASWDNDYSHG